MLDFLRGFFVQPGFGSWLLYFILYVWLSLFFGGNWLSCGICKILISVERPWGNCNYLWYLQHSHVIGWLSVPTNLPGFVSIRPMENSKDIVLEWLLRFATRLHTTLIPNVCFPVFFFLFFSALFSLQSWWFRFHCITPSLVVHFGRFSGEQSIYLVPTGSLTFLFKWIWDLGYGQLIVFIVPLSHQK